jgi:hypothetical protein
MANNGLAQLVTSLLAEPFIKWGLDFIGPIKSMGVRMGDCYILVATSMLPNRWRPEL